MTCDFTYVKPVGKVESATYDTATKRLSVTGIDLPTLLRPNVTELTGTYTTPTPEVTSSTDAPT